MAMTLNVLKASKVAPVAPEWLGSLQSYLIYKGASKPLRKPSKRYFKGLRSLRRRFPIPSGLRSSLKVPLKAWKVPYKGDTGASKVYSLAQR